MRYALALLLLCSTAYAEELPENFDSLPWTEKTASKWEGKIPPKYTDIYLSEKPKEDTAFKVYGIQEVETDKGVAYLVSIDEKEKVEAAKDKAYLDRAVLVNGLDSVLGEL